MIQKIKKLNIGGLSLGRILGVMHKEFKTIIRDRGTLALIITLPLVLLIIFGFALQLDPKNLPTAIISYDSSPLSRAIVKNMEVSGYFNIIETDPNEQRAQNGLELGTHSFVLTIPEDFTRKVVRGEPPKILLQIDSSDPGNTISAANHLDNIIKQSIHEFQITSSFKSADRVNSEKTFSLIVHRVYNESQNSIYSIIPGLIGVLLMITMVMITSTAIISERENGTMESLLATPVSPIEIMIGKVIPYLVLGYLQLVAVIFFGFAFLDLPIEGSLPLLLIAAAPFAIANLLIGLIFSTIARTAMQALQLSVYFQLPSIFLTGYIFSFHGMPQWAQAIGYLLPMTYFMRICRGIFLKGSSFLDLLPDILAICAIAVALFIVINMKFRKTMD